MSSDTPRPIVAELPVGAIPPGATHLKVAISEDANGPTVTWWAGTKKLIRGAGLGSGTGSMERITWMQIGAS